jgi:hypothetical protein
VPYASVLSVETVAMATVSTDKTRWSAYAKTTVRRP